MCCFTLMVRIHEYFRNHCGHSNEKTIQPYLSVLTSIILYIYGNVQVKKEPLGAERKHLKNTLRFKNILK